MKYQNYYKCVYSKTSIIYVTLVYNYSIIVLRIGVAMIDKLKIENAVKDILGAIGEDVTREGLKDTPKRVAEAYEEIFDGYNQEISNHTKAIFKSSNNNPVIVSNIKFYSMCEHHMLPFYGSVSIAYIPNGEVIGLSKLVRIVEIYTKRLQIQERLTKQIADNLFEELKCKGVYVEIAAKHMCMSMRGVKNNSDTLTSCKLGEYENNKELLWETKKQMGE